MAFRIEFGPQWNVRKDLDSQKRVTDQGLLRMVGGISTKGHWSNRGLALELLYRSLPCPLRKLNSIFCT